MTSPNSNWDVSARRYNLRSCSPLQAQKSKTPLLPTKPAQYTVLSVPPKLPHDSWPKRPSPLEARWLVRTTEVYRQTLFALVMPESVTRVAPSFQELAVDEPSLRDRTQSTSLVFPSEPAVTSFAPRVTTPACLMDHYASPIQVDQVPQKSASRELSSPAVLSNSATCRQSATTQHPSNRVVSMDPESIIVAE